MTDQLFDDEQAPPATKPRPHPVMMRPDEVINLKRARHMTGLGERTLRDWADEFGVARQSGEGGKLEFSIPALMMVKQGRLDLLERFRNGDRDSPDIREYFDVFGVPGPEILPDWVTAPTRRRNKECRTPQMSPALDPCEVHDRSEDRSGTDMHGNDRCVALTLSGGNVLRSYRTELQLAANREGMTVNQFALHVVGKHLKGAGAPLRGVFVAGDLEEDR
jgi:hypothetical protein